MTRHLSEKATEGRNVKSGIAAPWIVVAILLVCALVALFWVRPKNAATPEASQVKLQTSPPAKPSGPAPSELVGRWVRPDGGYVLELTEFAADGVIMAAYFNPHPINVGRAAWKIENGRLHVFVELRDVHYPGSTYTLVHDPAADRLSGIYFQAVQQQQFEVFFERTR